MLTALLSLFLAADTPPAEVPKVRLLVITGSHPFDPRLFALFEGHADIVWDKRTQFGGECPAFSPGFAEGYDAVLLYDFEFKIADAQKAAFEAAFGGGRGLIVMHHALCSHPDWAAYHAIAGGGYFFEAKDGGPPSEYKPDVPMRYAPAAGGHPILAGLEPFEVVEEPYKHVRRAEGTTPLLTAANEHSDEVVAWAHTHRDSRVVAFVPGHGGDIFVAPQYRHFVAQCVRWTAKRI